MAMRPSICVVDGEGLPGGVDAVIQLCLIHYPALGVRRIVRDACTCCSKVTVYPVLWLLFCRFGYQKEEPFRGVEYSGKSRSRGGGTVHRSQRRQGDGDTEVVHGRQALQADGRPRTRPVDKVSSAPWVGPTPHFSRSAGPARRLGGREMTD